MGALSQIVVLNMVICFSLIMHRTSTSPVDLTLGFTEFPLNTSNFHHDKPYNLPLKARYSFKHGVHRFWVHSTDKPLSRNSPTGPRSEIHIRVNRAISPLLKHTYFIFLIWFPWTRLMLNLYYLYIFQGYEYSSGVWQFEGQGFVPYGTSGVCIMQVFGAHPRRATTLMLRTYNGSLAYYRGPVLVPNIWGRWFRLNVIHDVEASNVKVIVDGVQVYEAPGQGGCSHYFKFGVLCTT